MRALRRMLRGSAFLQKRRFEPFVRAYAIARRTTPVQPDRIVFLSDSRADFSGNLAFLADEIRRQRPGAEVIGVFKPGLGARRPLRDAIRLPRLLASAQTIVVDDFYPLLYPLTVRPETRVLQVWHAAGAFKKMGWSRVGLPGGPLPGSLAHRNYTDATVSSERVRPAYAEAFAMGIDHVHALGVPRTDAFFEEARVRATAERVRSAYGVAAHQKIALFAPTFRGDSQYGASFDLDALNAERVASQLGDDWVVMVKLHPFVAASTSQRGGSGRVRDASGERELNDLLMAADVLITDYSSAIFEYALLRRPTVFFCPDLAEYTAARDFYFPFDEYATGPVVTESDELADAIRTARVGPDIETFIDRFMSACDGRSSERIVRDVVLNRRAEVDTATVAPGGTAAPTRIGGRIGVQLAVAWLARTTLSALYAPLKLLPSRRKLVMISREHPSEPEDFADLRAAVHAQDPSIEVVSLVRMVPPGILGKIRYALHMLAQLYHVATARVLVVDTYAIVASVLHHKRDLTVVQIWHALGAFKKFGLSILGQSEGRDERLAHAMRMHAGYDVVLASADVCRPAFAEAFGTAPSRIAVAPLPRVDRLRDPARREATRERIYARHPHLRGRRIAVFAPTFRLDGGVAVDAAELSRALETLGIHTVVKLHPLMHGSFGEAVDTAEGFSTQELLMVADLFITDYSSALFEAAVAEVPSYFLAPDLDDYLESRDFYLDYRTDLPGPIARTVDALVEQISREAATRADAVAFAARWVEVPDAAPPAAGATPCADHIAAIVRDAIGD